MVHAVVVSLKPQLVFKLNKPFGTSFDPTLKVVAIETDALLDTHAALAGASNPSSALALPRA